MLVYASPSDELLTHQLAFKDKLEGPVSAQ